MPDLTMRDRGLAKYRFTLPDDQIGDDIFAHSEGEACQELERLRPGASAHVVRLDRDDWWFLRTEASR